MKNNRLLLVFLLLCATIQLAHAQTDRVQVALPPVDSPPAAPEMDTQAQTLVTVESMQVLEQSVQALEQARFTEQEVKFNKRLRKISQTPDFIKAANNSLGALTLSGNLTDYLQDIGSLNNPENKELGLSLQTTITKIIDEKIFRNKNKVGKQDRGRFMNIVGAIIKSPLVSAVAGAIPIVSSLQSVTDLVTSLTVNNEDVSIEDYESYKQEVVTYVAFYEALGHAGAKFNDKINNLNIRIANTENIIRSFAVERTCTLYPAFLDADNTHAPINELTRNYLERDAIAKCVEEIMQAAMLPEKGRPDYEKMLGDPRLAFPDFAVNQARFITDELKVLGNDYLEAFRAYQTDIENVLTGSPNIVQPDKVEMKISSLRTKQAKLEKALLDAMNLEEVRSRFEKLAGIM